MSKAYRVVFQTYDKSNPKEVLSESCISESDISLAITCLDFGIEMSNQIELIQKIQDNILAKQTSEYDRSRIKQECPTCNKKLAKCGKQQSTFHDVFTDHTIILQRYKCSACGYELPSTVRQLLGGVQSGELQKIQSELGSTHTYRESQQLFSIFSCANRNINNHDRIKKVTESIGTSLCNILNEEKNLAVIEEAKELILNVDGGHIKTHNNETRSMEAMTSVIYSPNAVKSNKKDTRNYLTSKNCAASVSSEKKEIITNTIVAALKQGLGKSTNVTALCDGAANCWNVVDALSPLCNSMVCILDWFHVAMRIENIALPKVLKEKLLGSKWYLWRGDIDGSIARLDELIEESLDEKSIKKIKLFREYIVNNKDRIVNYEDRKNKGLVFTSNLAESTVESLINRRCKGQKHMRWSREGLNPLLQIRAAMHSKGEWENKWKTAILNAA